MRPVPAAVARTAFLVADLWVYPVKGCRGIALDRARLDARGIAGDRGWMVVDEGGRFLSQRRLPAMARIRPEPSGAGLILHHPGHDSLDVRSGVGEVRPVRVWGDAGMAVDAGGEAAQWLTEVLGLRCRLVRMSADWDRPVDPAYAHRTAQVGFADGFPLLLTNAASLAALNQRLEAPVPMTRFRPNIVVAPRHWERGEPSDWAFAEDHWSRLWIDGISFDVAKPCTRCKVTTVDQDTGQVAGPEPLAELARFRRVEGGVAFGMNLVHRGRGEIAVGSPVEVEAGAPGDDAA